MNFSQFCVFRPDLSISFLIAMFLIAMVGGVVMFGPQLGSKLWPVESQPGRKKLPQKLVKCKVFGRNKRLQCDFHGQLIGKI